MINEIVCSGSLRSGVHQLHLVMVQSFLWAPLEITTDDDGTKGLMVEVWVEDVPCWMMIAIVFRAPKSKMYTLNISLGEYQFH